MKYHVEIGHLTKYMYDAFGVPWYMVQNPYKRL